ncbi:TipJ family phage tail tip protein, partial [Cronobacter dublinensis]|uniref:TipJ family phage tail tip protein n=1 Tax=Cronobacter dublinensis TaxID=413497 RepID=UPI003D160014
MSNTQLSAVRVRLGVPSLQRMKDNGDVVGYRVDYKIELSTDGGGYVTVLNGAFDGKTTSLYERSHRIDLPPAR